MKFNLTTFNRARDIFLSLFGLYWLVGALVGGPSLTFIIDAVFLQWSPGLLLDSIMSGYDVFRNLIKVVLNPFIKWFSELLSHIPFFLREPNSYWVDVFTIIVIWLSAIARMLMGYLGWRFSVLIFLAASIFALFFIIIGSSVHFSGVVLREVMVGTLPVFVACYVAILIRPLITIISSDTGGYLKSIVMVMWLPFGVATIMTPGVLISVYFIGATSGAGIFCFFLLSFVISSGAAIDALKSGDDETGKLFLMICGPFLGLIFLVIFDLVFEWFVV